jgi:HK97 family phage portal protein
MIYTAAELEKAIKQMNFQQVAYTDWDRAKITNEIQTNGYLYSILQTLARASANVNFMVGRTLSDGAFEEDRRNQLATILNNPNADLNHKQLIQQCIINYAAYGECFIFFETYQAGNNKGQIVPNSIRLLPPEITDITIEGFQVIAYVVNSNSVQQISPENVIHLKNYNPKWDDPHGLSPVAVAGTLIDKLNAANDTETKTYQNSGPAQLISAKAVDAFSDESYINLMTKLKRIWKKPENKRGVIGSSSALEVHQLGMSPVDMGAIDSQKNTVKALLTIWGLDAGLFDTDASTYNNKMLQSKATYTECVLPFLELFYDKITSRFGKAYGNVEVQLDSSNVDALQPNYKEKVEWMVFSGVFTDNEIRAALSYDMRDSEESDLTPNENLARVSTAGFSNDNLNSNLFEP